MSMILRGAFGGKLRLWWHLHERENIRALQLAALVALYLLASHFDHQDQLAVERTARKAAEHQLWQRGAFSELAPVTFLFTASTPEELQRRHDEVYDALGAVRYVSKYGNGAAKK